MVPKSLSKLNSLKKRKKGTYLKIIFIVSGILATVWFLIRVIPKPSRAAYPCQRAAFPIMSSFVIWVTGFLISYFSFKRARKLFERRRYLYASMLSVVFLISASILYATFTGKDVLAFIVADSSIPVLNLRETKLTDKTIAPDAFVSIVKSEESSASEITQAEVENMVFEAIELAGGLEDIVSDGDTVVLKPNLVHIALGEDNITTEVSGMTTDWRVAAAVAAAVRDVNPNGKIFVIEGSAVHETGVVYDYLRYNKTNIPDADEIFALEAISGEWGHLESDKLIGVDLADKGLCPLDTYHDSVYRDWAEYKIDKLYYNKLYYNADVLISIPVLKNHETAGITGAVKNVSIGALPANIYGWDKDYMLRVVVEHNDRDNFHKFLHDFYIGKPVDFAVMDGLQGYNYGPTEGGNYGASLKSHQENMRIILASKDPIALDAVEGLLMGDDPRKVPYLIHLNNSGVGTINPKTIKIVGEQIGGLKKDFPHGSYNANIDDYSDFTPPEAELLDMNIKNDTLNIMLDVDETTTRVDIEISGVSYKPIFTSGFDTISIPTAGFSIPTSQVIVIVQDEYLNSKRLSKNNPTVITESANEIIIRAYPNPVFDQLNIEVANECVSDIMIFDVKGNMVSSVITEYSDLYVVNSSELAKGIYVGVVENSYGSSTFKFTKE